MPTRIVVTATTDLSSLPPPPGPRFRTPLGLMAAIRRDILRLFTESVEQYGQVVSYRAPSVQLYLLAHPDHIRRVLQDNNRNYWKGRVFERLKRIAGNGILFSDGDVWRRQRKLAQPAFAKSRLVGMDRWMVEPAQGLLARWEKRYAESARKGDDLVLEVTHDMSGLALEIVTRALFGSDFAISPAEFRANLDVAVEYANYLIMTFLPAPLWLPTPRNRQALRTRRYLHQTLDRLVADRREKGTSSEDLLGMLIAARDDETDEGMDDRQLRDELITFINAGHETTAVALSWTWYVLSRHPEVERRLHEELDSVLGGRSPTHADLPSLPFTRAVVDETLRLYPPAWGVGRESIDADEMGGYRIEARAGIFLSPWTTHRHPGLWDAPDRFDPERFLGDELRKKPRYAYFPFGGGPRMCIGSSFALMELVLVLATLAQRVRLRLLPGHPVVPDPIFTLRPKHGLRMTLEPR
jgi:cytochrome P450